MLSHTTTQCTCVLRVEPCCLLQAFIHSQDNSVGLTGTVYIHHIWQLIVHRSLSAYKAVGLANLKNRLLWPCLIYNTARGALLCVDQTVESLNSVKPPKVERIHKVIASLIMWRQKSSAACLLHHIQSVINDQLVVTVTNPEVNILLHNNKGSWIP